MRLKNEYRPANIEFAVSSQNLLVPENLGFFETAEESAKFIHENLTAINSKCQTNRYIDNFEKSEIRKEYQELLEIKLPFLERELQEATHEFESAKKKLAEAKEYVNATTNEVKALANDVKVGLRNIELDDKYTYRIAFANQYYFFTWIDKQLKLAKVLDIPEHEKHDLYNAMSVNNKFFSKENTSNESLENSFLNNE